MSWFWVGAIVGLSMLWGGATKSTVAPYRFLHARAALLWKDKAHLFLQIAGLVVIIVMVALALSN